MNTFSLREKQADNYYSKTISLSFTDNAIDRVAPVLSGHVPLTTPISRQQRIVVTEPTNALPPSERLNEETESSKDESDLERIIEDVHLQNNNSCKPLEYFVKDGQDYLISTSPDYKGKNKKNQQERFCLLYVWAYNLIYKTPVPNKEHLNCAARKNKIYDKNFSKYFDTVTHRFFLQSEDTFQLNRDGLPEVNRILIEIQDSNVKGIEYINTNRKAVNRTPTITQEEQQEIEQWLQCKSRLDDFDVRSLDTTVKHAIFALYVITKELKVTDSVKPALAYEYLVRKYKTISINKKNFSDTLGQKKYAKYFSRTPEGCYFLTPEAENLVENLLNQGNGQS